MPHDHLAELRRQLENDAAERERCRQVEKEREEGRRDFEERVRRFHAAFEAAFSWTREAIARAEKPSPNGYFAWAERWLQLGEVLRSCDGARGRLESAETSGAAELEYAARLLLFAMDGGTRQQLAEALAAINVDPVARRCILWLPYIGDAIWLPADGTYSLAPKGVTNEDRRRADAAFGYQPVGTSAFTSLPDPETRSEPASPAEAPGTDSPPPVAEPEWTKADSPSKWAKCFGISAKTFKNRVKDGSIRAKRLSDRLYQVAISDLPTNPTK